MAPGAGGVLPTLRRAASAQSTGLRRMAPHQDHAKWKSKARIESDTAAIAYQTGATEISNYAVISWLGKNGVKNTRPQNPGGIHQILAERNVPMPFIPVPCPMVLTAAAPAVSWSSPRMPIFIIRGLSSNWTENRVEPGRDSHFFLPHRIFLLQLPAAHPYATSHLARRVRRAFAGHRKAHFLGQTFGRFAILGSRAGLHSSAPNTPLGLRRCGGLSSPFRSFRTKAPTYF
jgi:hypothetical protein